MIRCRCFLAIVFAFALISMPITSLAADIIEETGFEKPSIGATSFAGDDDEMAWSRTISGGAAGSVQWQVPSSGNKIFLMTPAGATPASNYVRLLLGPVDLACYENVTIYTKWGYYDGPNFEGTDQIDTLKFTYTWAGVGGSPHVDTYTGTDINLYDFSSNPKQESFSVPAGATSVSVEIELRGSSTNETVAIDDISFEGDGLGTITIIKEIESGSSSQEFEFLGKWAEEPDENGEQFSLTGGGSKEFTDVPPHDYIVKEIVPDGWELLDIVCTGAEYEVTDNEVSFTVCDEDITCTFTNRPERPIPTLSQWGLIIISLLLSGAAFLAIRRRKTLS